MKTLLVPVDFSSVTSAVTRVACQLAGASNSHLVLLHIVQIPLVMEPYGVSDAALLEASIVSEKIADRKLAALVKQCERKVASVEGIQETGQPVGVIVAKARELKADFIVIGSHGHGAVYDLLIGSTAQGVLRRAGCPVVVVPGVQPQGTRKAKR